MKYIRLPGKMVEFQKQENLKIKSGKHLSGVMWMYLILPGVQRQGTRSLCSFLALQVCVHKVQGNGY